MENLKYNLIYSYNIYNNYIELLNSYVLDFFTEQHWSKLPKNWQTFLNDLNPNDLIQLLDYNQPLNIKIWPLSLICLKKILKNLCLSRTKIDLNFTHPSKFSRNEKIMKLFWKNVKAKKRHEISIMSKICYNSGNKTKSFYIVDVGSGLGHLSRILAYEYDFNVCSIEAQECLNEQAEKLNEKFEKLLSKITGESTKDSKIIHIHKRIESNIKPSEFLNLIKSAFEINDDNFSFGIVGLHPCGDLGATLLRLYNKISNIKFINIVGCCYMKLSTTTSISSIQGFPLSSFCQQNQFNLSYSSREVACHAIENFIEKLLQGELWKLKIHCYRAVIEKIIVTLHPHLRHSALSNVKYSEDLNFESYCKKALVKLKIDLPQSKVKDELVYNYLAQWKKVIVFYSLRLLIAPLIETIILIDRILYIQESGSHCVVVPVFDSKISPRNQVLIAIKNS